MRLILAIAISAFLPSLTLTQDVCSFDAFAEQTATIETALCIPPEGTSINPGCTNDDHVMLLWDFWYGRDTDALFCNYSYPMETDCAFDIDEDPILLANIRALMEVNNKHDLQVNLQYPATQCGGTTGYLKLIISCGPPEVINERNMDLTCDEIGVDEGFGLDDRVPLCPEGEDMFSFTQDDGWFFNGIYKNRESCLAESEDVSQYCKVSINHLRLADCWNTAEDCTWRDLMLAADCDPYVYKFPLFRVNTYCNIGPCTQYDIDTTQDPEDNPQYSSAVFDCSAMPEDGDYPDPASPYTRSYITCTGSSAEYQQCEEGEIFHPVDRACTDSDNPCAGEVNGSTQPLPGLDGDANPCHVQYITCQGGQAVDSVCSIANEYYATWSGLCVPADDQECVTRCKPQYDNPDVPRQYWCDFKRSQEDFRRIDQWSFVRFEPEQTGRYWFKIYFDNANAGTFTINRLNEGDYFDLEFYYEYNGAIVQLENAPLDGTEFIAYSSGAAESSFFYLVVNVLDLDAWNADFNLWYWDAETPTADTTRIFRATYDRYFIYPCDSNPCKNDGICVNTEDNDYTCVCQGGWGGKDCDEEVCAPCMQEGNVYAGANIQKCSQQWHTYDPATDSCYYVTRNARTLLASAEICADQDQGLIMPVFDQASVDLLNDLLGGIGRTEEVWIGINRGRSADQQVIGPWEYNNDGALAEVDSNILTANWDDGYPVAGYGRDQVYVRKMRDDSLVWRNGVDEPEYKRRVVCKYAPESVVNDEPVGMCRGSGDPHYVTFDGKKYSFQGKCDYTLFNYTDSESGDTWLVNVEQRRKTERTDRDVTFVTGMQFIAADGTEVYISESSQILVNGVATAMPYRDSSAKFCVQLCDGSPAVTTTVGIQAEYKGSKGNKVKVLASGALASSVDGLCGNFNGDASDDIGGADVFVWGQSFLTADAETCGADDTESDADLTVQCETVSGPTAGAYADLEVDCRDQFGLLGEACWGMFSTEEQDAFVAECALDTCYAGGVREGMVGALATAASVCQASQTQVDEGWKFEGGQIISAVLECGVNEEYAECGSPCEATCATPDAAALCEDSPCISGCVCAPGYIRDGFGACVREEFCGCYNPYGAEDIQYVNIGEYFVASCNDGAVCRCDGQNVVTCTNDGCAAGATCTDGRVGCSCSEGLVGDGYHVCVNATDCPVGDDSCDVNNGDATGGYVVITGLDNYFVEYTEISEEVTFSGDCSAARVHFSFVSYFNVEVVATATADPNDVFVFTSQDGFHSGYSVVINQPFSVTFTVTGDAYYYGFFNVHMECLTESACDDNNQCMNGGTCVDELVGYSCDCPEPFYGPHCQYDLDVCSEDSCSGNGECVPTVINGFSFAVCVCDAGWTGDNCNLPDGIVLVCDPESDDFFIAVDYSVLDTADRDLVLNEASCVLEKQTDPNGQYFWYRFNSTTCGTTRQVTNANTGTGENNIEYINRISYADDAGEGSVLQGEGISITRSSNWGIDLKCIYCGDGVVRSEFGTKEEDGYKIGGANELDFSLHVAQSAAYQSYMSGTFALGEEVFLEARLDTNVDGVTMMAKKCWGSPSSNPDDARRYIITSDQCDGETPVDEATFVRITTTPGYVDRFSVEAFAIVGQDQQQVYIHCEVQACISSNAAECDAEQRCVEDESGIGLGGRARRATEKGLARKHVTLAQPVVFVAQEAANTGMNGMMIGLVGGVMLMATIVLVLAVMLLRASRAVGPSYTLIAHSD